jgi:hypothetical protein
MFLLLACRLSILATNAEYASHRNLEPSNLKQTYKKKTEYSDCEQHFPKPASRSHKHISTFFVEGSHRLPNLDLQHNGLELTCGARFTAPHVTPHEVRATAG